MTRANYMEKILDVYTSTFNIERNYKFDNKEFSAYGYFTSSCEKYVLVEEVNLWKAFTEEHTFFLDVEDLNQEDLGSLEEMIKSKIEKDFVRKGEKYPPKNHMKSVISLVLVSSRPINDEIIKKIESFKFNKMYLFSIRGYLETKILAVDMKNRKVYHNKLGSDLLPLYEKTLGEIYKN